MIQKEQGLETKREVYKRWKGKCAFCGIDLTIEQHHIVAKNNDPSLIDDPDNLILLCSNHHTLTQKLKPDGKPCISFVDIEDLKNSKYATADKSGFYFDVPQNFQVSLGNNLCRGCPYILVVNNRPLVEMWPQKTTHYSDEIRFYLYMRFFDEENNFIGGMFANHWASVVNEDWDLNIGKNVIEAKHKTKPVFVKFNKTAGLSITGTFYFNEIKIEAKENELILPINNKFIDNNINNCEVAFNISGNKTGASLGICGRLNFKEN